MDKQLITQAFEKLGPDKVQHGLTAKHAETKQSFVGCFLALCYGPPGALYRVAHTPGNPTYMTLLGISGAQMEAVYTAFDFSHDEFCALACEWLELNVLAHQQAPSESYTEAE